MATGGRRTALALTGAAVAALAVVSAAGAAKPPGALPTNASIRSVHFVQAPLGVSNRQVTVVVQLAQDPVAVQDANSASGLSDSQQAQAASQLRQQQAPVASQIRAQGGQVLAQYQYAYNGIKVRIRASDAGKLKSLAGVTAVYPVQLMQRDDTQGVPLIGVPAVWSNPTNLHGEHLKIAIADTGLDFTHADFGGNGDPGLYTLEHDNETADPNSLGQCAITPCIGPGAPRVKGGIDLVGDAYQPDSTQPNYDPTPVPDPNPIDCDGHGSHVAGIAGGSGVLSDGTTYTGPYDSSTIASHSWNVGPGVAPQADLYPIKIFGCTGPTGETLDAIDWAVKNHMDVLNLSLGSPFGSGNDPSAEAADNAARMGVIVVAADGNEGPSPYMTGTPASGTGALSVAAVDGSAPTLDGADLALSSGTVTLSVSNDVAPTYPLTAPVYVMPPDPAFDSSDTGPIGHGCNPADYTPAAGDVVITSRNGCDRVARDVFASEAGAAAVVMVNAPGSPGYPPQEGHIAGGTVPFYGGLASDTDTFAAASGDATLQNPHAIANPVYKGLADFSSWGPRTGDSFLKPDVAAPGVSVLSAGIGTGTLPASISGTSQATPFASGLAALVKQAHPTWRRPAWWKAAIVNTADPTQVTGAPSASGMGTGLIQALPAVQTQAVATGDQDAPALNFGFNELSHDFNKTDRLQVRNFGPGPVTFAVSTGNDFGVPHTASIQGPATVTVRPGDSVGIPVRLTVPAASSGDGLGFFEAGGLVTLTPQGGTNDGVTLRVPYYVVPKPVSDVEVDLSGLNRRTNTATATIRNHDGAIPGSADFYAWGLQDSRDHGLGSNDLRFAGVQSFLPQGFPYIVFGIATQKHWSNPSQNEFDVLVDVDGDGNPDYDVVATDSGAVLAGDFNGIDQVFVVNLHTGNATTAGITVGYPDQSTITLPVLVSQLCDTGAPCLDGSTNVRFSYTVQAFGLTDNTEDDFTDTATFNPFSPAISTGMYDVVPPHASATETVTVDPAEWQQSPALGVLAISTENASGRAEVSTMRLNVPRH